MTACQSRRVKPKKDVMNRSASKISGNMLIYILGAVFLLGILIVLLKGNFQEGTGIDAEKVGLKVSEVQRYASELERGVNYVIRNGRSESDIRFAIPDSVTTEYGDITSEPDRQVFDPKGGGVEYAAPPVGVNDGTAWQFYATTHIKDLGTNDSSSSKAELLAVLPNVTQAFCSRVNMQNQQTVNLNNSTMTSGCVYDAGHEFDGTYGIGTITLKDGEYSKSPAKEMCVNCAGDYNYYRVLLTR